MRTDVKGIADRLEHVLASDQWTAMKKSFATRMDVDSVTSFSMNEQLGQGELKLYLNYELRGDEACLTTYSGKITPTANRSLTIENVDVAPEVLFNAEGKYAFSFKEAINLLEGRAVLKSYYRMDAVQRTDWFKLDKGGISKPLQPFFSGGQFVFPDFDLEGALGKLPMVTGDFWMTSALVRSLQQGDLHEVKLLSHGKEIDVYMKAAPELKGLSFLDEKLKPVRLENLLEPARKLAHQKKRNPGLSMGV